MCFPKHFPSRQPFPWACAMLLSVSELKRLQVQHLQGLPVYWAFLVLGCVLSSSPGPWHLPCFPFLVNCPSLSSLLGMGKRSFQLPLFLLRERYLQKGCPKVTGAPPWSQGHWLPLWPSKHHRSPLFLRWKLEPILDSQTVLLGPASSSGISWLGLAESTSSVPRIHRTLIPGTL